MPTSSEAWKKVPDSKMLRLAVPGGWLYREQGRSDVAPVFVPKPMQEIIDAMRPFAEWMERIDKEGVIVTDSVAIEHLRTLHAAWFSLALGAGK